MKEAMIEYAKKNGKTPEEVESLIYQQAINLMVRGEFSFHRDYMDRIHGKPKETIDLQGEIKTSKIAETQEILRKALKK
jgi:hypothetical protein